MSFLKSFGQFIPAVGILDSDITPFQRGETGVEGAAYYRASMSNLVEYIAGKLPPTSTVWGDITGTLSNQTDLVAALASKYDASNPAGFITISALSPYLTITEAASTYATQNSLSSGLAAKANIAGQIFTGAISATNLSGTNTGDQTSVTGNAGTATALQNARTINGISFDGTANIVVAAAAGTLTGASLAATVVGSSLSAVGTIATGVWQGTAIADAYIASAATWNAKESALTFSTGLTRAADTITNNLSTGVAGGQSVIGGTGSGDNLNLSSTNNSTKGRIYLGTASYYTQVNDILALGLGLWATALDTTNPAKMQLIIPSGSGTRGITCDRYGTQASSGAAFTMRYRRGDPNTPTGPVAGDISNSFAYYASGSSASFFSNPSFTVRHTVGSIIGSSLCEVNTSLMTTSTATGTPVASITMLGQSANVGIQQTAPTTTLHVNGPIRCASYTVATLPSASAVGNGTRTFVTDALAPVFQATVAGGGAVYTPVYSDGTAWKVG